ncbi:MAG: hypothetical protein NTU83_09450 [Candidatus Hydrogenedentes bacterium]|nr:hypothetical protein [Candidatus Hydrogenedentota bacterium]
MDKKGIVAYLGITLVLSCAIQMLVLYVHVLSPAYFLLLAIPAFAAWTAGRLSPRPEFSPGVLWPIPLIRALRVSCAIYLLFAVVFLITTIVGFTRPDWSIGELLAQVPSYNQIQVPDHIKPMVPTVILLLSFVLTFVIAPTIYAALMVGQVYGWCGYLLPRLMPLGRWTAYGLVGLASCFSMMPMVFVTSSGSWPAHVFQALAYAVALSAMIGEVWRRSGSLGLTAVCAGCVYCHASSLWGYLFPANATVFPWGGTTGLFFTLAWALVALAPDEVFGPLERSRYSAGQPDDSQAPDAGEAC